MKRRKRARKKNRGCFGCLAPAIDIEVQTVSEYMRRKEKRKRGKERNLPFKLAAQESQPRSCQKLLGPFFSVSLRFDIEYPQPTLQTGTCNNGC